MTSPERPFVTESNNQPETIEEYIARFDKDVLLRWLNAGYRAHVRRRMGAPKAPSVAGLNRFLKTCNDEEIKRIRDLALSTS